MKCTGCDRAAPFVVDEGCYRCGVCGVPHTPDGMTLVFKVSCRTEREARLVVGAASFMASGIDHKWLVSPDYGKRGIWWAAVWADESKAPSPLEYDDAMDLYEGACQE